MKKFLALLLTILMIGGMLPTVFAADAVMNPVYVFSNTTFGGSGNVQYHMHSGTGTFNSSISSGYYEYVHNVGLGAFPLLEAVHVWTAEEEAFGNCALILKADVDVCGTYDVAIDYVRSGYAGRIGIYFVPVSWLDANYAVKSITMADVKPIINNENAICLVKDYDTHSSAGTGSRYNVNDVKFSENEYYIFITSDKSDYPSTSNGRYYASIKNIALTGKAYATATISDATLRVGDVAAMSVTAQAADGAATEISDVTYASSNPDVATVAADGKVTAIGEGSTVITATGTAGGVTVSASVKVEVSFDYIYSFTMEAVPGATKAVPVSTITSFGKLDPEVSTGDYYYVTNKNFSTFSLYSGGTQCYSVKQNTGDSYIIFRGKVDEPGVYDTEISFGKAKYGGRLNVYVVPKEYAERKWDMSSSALTISEIIADNGVTKVFSVDCHENGTDVTPMKGAKLNLTEKDFYFIITTEMGAADTADGRYYGLQKHFIFDCKAALTAELSKDIKKVGESAKISVSAKNASGRAATPENITYKSSDTSVAKVSTDGTVTIVGNGNATITTTANVGGVAVSANSYIDSIPVWDPQYILAHTAVESATAEIKNGLVLSKVTGLKEDISTGNWSYVNQLGVKAGGLYQDELVYQVAKTNFGKNAIVLALDIDKAGTYIPTLIYNKKSYIGKVNAYLLPESYVAEKGWKMTSNALPIETIESEAEAWRFASANGYSTSSVLKATLDGDALKLDEKTYLMLVLHNNNENIITDSEANGSRLWGEVRGVSLTRTGSVKVLADKTTLTKGDTTKLIATVKDNRDNATTAEVTYESLNTSVATVSGSTVEAVAPGVATIKATATVGGVTVSDTVEITVGEETVAKKVSIATSINGEENVASYNRGSSVTVEAPEIAGKVFRHWVRGTVENGDWVSADAKYSFTATTHTYLTAVYTNEATGKLVEFFNGNGEYLSEAIADADGKVALPANPSITGYVFSKWLLDKDTEFTADTILTADVTRVVADFTDNNETYEVNGKEYKYGEEANFESDIDVVWYRNEKAVAYGKSYTYYVWDDAEIVCKEESAAPMVVLDKDVKSDNAYMIEYDACGKNIVEVGIIFGSGNHTVDSCDSKATSQRGLKRGQFTAKPGKNGAKVARGYLVYEENGAYKVVYSK